MRRGVRPDQVVAIDLATKLQGEHLQIERVWETLDESPVPEADREKLLPVYRMMMESDGIRSAATAEVKNGPLIQVINFEHEENRDSWLAAAAGDVPRKIDADTAPYFICGRLVVVVRATSAAPDPLPIRSRIAPIIKRMVQCPRGPELGSVMQ